MFNKIKKHLVIIGAGYAGMTLVHKLDEYKDLQITLINKDKLHLHQTDIHKYIADYKKSDELFFDIEKYSKQSEINFIKDEALDINFDEKKILLKNHEEVSYDYLVIATGSVSFFPPQIKNINNYAKDIKDIKVLNEYKKEFFELIKNKRKNKNVAIVGAGLSGVEIALEFAQVLKDKNIGLDECSISLIEQQKDILPFMDEFLVNTTRKKCDDLKIKRFHGKFVTNIEDNKVILEDSQEVSFDMIIFVIGVTSQKLVSSSKVEINIKNQFVVDEYLRVKNYKDVFAIGDIAQTKDKNGNYTLPTAQMAKLHADLTSKNIINTITNKELIKNNLETKGVMIDLTNKDAVGLVLGLKIKGLLAYFLKRFVSNNHKKIFK